jgi:hypothetical protein
MLGPLQDLGQHDRLRHRAGAAQLSGDLNGRHGCGLFSLHQVIVGHGFQAQLPDPMVECRVESILQQIIGQADLMAQLLGGRAGSLRASKLALQAVPLGQLLG